MGTDSEAHSQTLQRVRDVETPSHKWDIFIKSLPLCLKELYKRGGGKSVSASRDGTKQAEFSKHINSKKLRQLAQGLHGYVLEDERRNGHLPPYHTEKQSPIDDHLQCTCYTLKPHKVFYPRKLQDLVLLSNVKDFEDTIANLLVKYFQENKSECN